jgi:hypothetical protein
LVHLGKRFQRRFFWNRPIRNKNCLWWPCLLIDRDEISNHYRGSSKDASYQVSVHLAKQFQRRSTKKIAHFVSIRWQTCLPQAILVSDYSISKKIFSSETALPNEPQLGRKQRRFFWNRPIRNKNCLWWPCLLIDRDEMSNRYRGPSIDASYQVSVFVLFRWQRWPPQEILVSDWSISKKSSFLKPLCQMNRNLVGSIYERSSIKIDCRKEDFLEIDQSETRISCGGHLCQRNKTKWAISIVDLP